MERLAARMVKSWLGTTSVDAFLESNPGKPWASPGIALDLCSLFSWDTFDRLLGEDRLDLLVVAGGRDYQIPLPRSLREARALMRTGLGFVLRHAEEHDEALASLARSFALDPRGAVHVQLFVTPAGTHGFGWHYDLEEVFLAQTAGTKDYYMRANTVALGAASGARLDFEPFHRERSPIQTARLIPGDCLYIPSRWWHVARSVEDSLSISLGVLRPDAPTAHPAV